MCAWVLSLQLCLTLCDPMDCCLPGSSVHRILQARTVEWVSMPSSRRSSQPRDRTCLLQLLIAGRFFTTEPLGKPKLIYHAFSKAVNGTSVNTCSSLPGGHLLGSRYWSPSPGVGNGYPLQHSCLENPVDRGAWQAAVHGVARSRTELKQLSTHALLTLTETAARVSER